MEAVAWEKIEARRHEVPLCAGVVELLDDARRERWQVAIGTGAQRAVLEHHLGHLGVLERFDEIVTAADVVSGKPAPDIFVEVARRLGRAPSECVVLEDSLRKPRSPRGCRSSSARVRSPATARSRPAPGRSTRCTRSACATSARADVPSGRPGRCAYA